MVNSKGRFNNLNICTPNNITLILRHNVTELKGEINSQSHIQQLQNTQYFQMHMEDLPKLSICWIRKQFSINDKLKSYFS